MTSTVSRHEAGHVVTGWLIGFSPRYARIGTDGGGLVDLAPNFKARPSYRDPALAPFALFLLAGTDAFDKDGYSGPLPTALPVGGARAVADVMTILVAGYAVGGDAQAEHDSDLSLPGSDAAQVAILVECYPEVGVIRDNLLAWMPPFLTDVGLAVDMVASAFRTPSQETSASWLGLADLKAINAGLGREQWWLDAERRIAAQLDGLAWIVEHRLRNRLRQVA